MLTCPWATIEWKTPAHPRRRGQGALIRRQMPSGAQQLAVQADSTRSSLARTPRGCRRGERRTAARPRHVSSCRQGGGNSRRRPSVSRSVACRGVAAEKTVRAPRWRAALVAASAGARPRAEPVLTGPDRSVSEVAPGWWRRRYRKIPRANSRRAPGAAAHRAVPPWNARAVNAGLEAPRGYRRAVAGPAREPVKIERIGGEGVAFAVIRSETRDYVHPPPDSVSRRSGPVLRMGERV